MFWGKTKTISFDVLAKLLLVILHFYDLYIVEVLHIIILVNNKIL